MVLVETKSSFNDARKLRRKLLIARNLEKSGTSKKASSSDRNSERDALSDFSKKDNKSGRGRYI